MTATPVEVPTRHQPGLTRSPSSSSRGLHPGAWWLWAIGLATVASRTTNPLLLALVLAVAGYVVTVARPVAPWASSYSVLLRVAGVVVAIRVAFAALFAEPVGTHVLVTLPEIPLPEWAAGVRLGGPITVEQLLVAAGFGLSLATVLVCFGAATSLASPSRLLASLPAALYEVGLTVVVALTFVPQLVADVARVRTAAHLRGRRTGGPRALATAVTPVLEGSLERALELAAALDARGYGRVAPVPTRVRRTSAGLLLLALVGTCVGLFGLLGDSGWYPLPLLVMGVLAGVTGLRLGGRRSVRTRYRSQAWGLREILVAGSGLLPAVVAILVTLADPAALRTEWVPLAWPDLPVATAVAVLVAALPALVAPRPTSSARRVGEFYDAAVIR